MIKIRFMLAIAISVFAGCSSSDTPRSGAVAELKTLKQVTWPGIYADKDAQALEAFLADDFVMLAGGQLTPKTDEVEWLRNAGDWSPPEDFSYQVIDILMVTPDAAIVYGKGISTRENDAEQPCRHSYFSSNTLRRVNEKWHPVFSHVSDASCEVVETGRSSD
ncbi:MAG: nuclear transport factor 2 family protein [Gammaproteobacteria bacterium]|nr:nuclear transport factor 2 family protein [Gammaproteobacteria bacterium]